MTVIEAPAQHDFLALAESILAQAGYAVVSRETAAALESIERRWAWGELVPLEDLEAVIYAIYSGQFGEPVHVGLTSKRWH